MDLSEQYEALVHSNPFRMRREELHLTQQQLADELEFTVQFIYRHEVGLLNSPSWLVANTLNEDSLIDQYYAWQQEMRAFIRPLVGKNIFFEPYGVVSSDGHEHPFSTFMYNVTGSVGKKLGVTLPLNSQQLFCRMITVHPWTVQQYMTNNSAHIVGLLSGALVEIGIEVPDQQRLAKQVAMYKRRQLARL